MEFGIRRIIIETVRKNRRKNMRRTAENITVVIIVVAILIGLFCFVGYDNIKAWLSTPFV